MYNEQFAKIGFNSLKSESVPDWFFRHILERFAQLFDSWKAQAQSLHFSTDIQLWIYENNWLESEIVIAKIEEPDDKRDNYFDQTNEERNLPLILQKLNKFDWELFVAKHRYYVETDELTADEIADLIEQGFVLESNSTEVCYSKIHDFVWVGRISDR